MALTPLDLAKLAYPFRRDDHDFLEGYVYIQEEAITERLDTVDPNWSISIDEAIGYGDSIVVLSTLTVQGVKRSNAGGNPVQREKKDKTLLGQLAVADNGVNAHKGAATDALKRCARMFGIGRYLLSAPKEGSVFNDWLAEEHKAAKARLDALRTVDTNTGEITPKNGVEAHQPPPTPSAQPTPVPVRENALPASTPKASSSIASTPASAPTDGASAKTELFPDEPPVVEGAVVVKLPPQVGTIDMQALGKRAFDEKLVHGRNHFADLMTKMVAEGWLRDAMNADQVIEAVKKREADKDLAKEGVGK